jgi:protocatechuate 3,4-dioxygenase beta subunit
MQNLQPHLRRTVIVIFTLLACLALFILGRQRLTRAASPPAPLTQGKEITNELVYQNDDLTLTTPLAVSDQSSLQQTGVITGRVTDEGGAPIEGLHIAAIRVSDEAWYGGPDTDADGYYVFDSVPPTDVYVYACSGCNDQPYLDEYYDDALTQDQADVLSVTPGLTITGINFSLTVGGVISGRVYQENGVTPIEGADVQLDDYDSGQWRGHTTTQADGSYTLRRLPSGDYRVSASAPDYLQEFYQEVSTHDQARRVTVSAPDATTGIDFTLDRGDAVIRGHVRYKDGTPIPHIRVYAGRWHRPGGTWTFADANGAYTLTVTAGNWVVEGDRWDSQVDGHTLTSTPLIAIGSGETVQDVDIAFWPNDAAVVGVVREQDDTPVPNALVYLLDETTGWWLSREVVADASGTYTLGVPAGTWRINAWYEDYIQPPQQQITLSPGETLHKDLYLNAVRASISGRVLDQNGAPVPGAWTWSWNPKLEGGGAGTHADASGTYTLSVHAGIWHIEAGHPPNYTSLPGRAVIVTETQYLSGIDLRLNKATAVVQGVVRLGSDSGPSINLQADTRIDSRDQNEWIHHQTIGNSGFYTSGVTAGRWDAYAHLDGYTCQGPRPVTINDGETRSVNLVLLTNTAIISGAITDQYGFPVPNADVSIQDPVTGREMIPWNLGWADSAGQYTVGVAAGTWRVCVWRDGYDGPSCPTITLGAGEGRTLNFVIQSRTSAINGLVTDLNLNPADNAPLAGANVLLWDQYGIAPLSDSEGPLVGDTSGADGRFDLSLQISSGPYLVRAFKEHYAYGEGLVFALGGRHPAGTIRLSEQGGGALSGQVTTGGNPLANAVVVARQAGSRNSALTQDGALARTTTDATGNYVFDAPLAPGDYTLLASAIGYEQATTTASVIPGSTVVAGDLVLTPTSIPNYGVAYLTVNMTTTMEESHDYPALVQVHNVGSETWVSSGREPVQFYHEWRDRWGNLVQDWTLAWLPYDIQPGGTTIFPVSLWTPGVGEYMLKWGLWRDGNWLGRTQTFDVIVMAQALPNLHVSQMDLATDPPTLREGKGFDLLVFVHNDSNVDAYNVNVNLYADGNPFGAGRYTLPVVPRRGTILLRATSYVPLRQGPHDLLARVDPDDEIAERSELDNDVSRDVQVLPPSSDSLPPSGTIMVEDGALTTNSTQVQLSLSAEDNPGGSGVRQVYVTEFVYNGASGQWQIVAESGWVDYATSMAWTLSPVGGVKHFQARFADGAQNVSDAALAWINYTPDCDNIALAEWKLYQWQLEPGDVMTTTVRPCGGQGDPDLYAWIGPSGGSPHYYSSNAGVAPDTIRLTASDANTYNFWVYGFEATTFDLTMAYSPGASGTIVVGQGRGTKVQGQGKALPIVPPSTIETPTYVPERPMYKVYLYLVFRNCIPDWEQ